TVRPIEPPSESVLYLAVRSDGTLRMVGREPAVSLARDGHVTNARLDKRRSYGGEGAFFSVLNPRAELVGSAWIMGNALLWDSTTGQKVRDTAEGHRRWISALAFSPDGATLASGSYDTTVLLMDVATGKKRRTLKHTDVVQALAWSPDG